MPKQLFDINKYNQTDLFQTLGIEGQYVINLIIYREIFTPSKEGIAKFNKWQNKLNELKKNHFRQLNTIRSFQ